MEQPRTCPECNEDLTQENSKNGAGLGDTAILKCNCGATTSWFNGVQFKTLLPGGGEIVHNADAISQHF